MHKLNLSSLSSVLLQTIITESFLKPCELWWCWALQTAFSSSFLIVSPASLLQDGCWRVRSWKRSVWEETSPHPLLCLHRPLKDQSALKAAKVSYSEACLRCQRNVFHVEREPAFEQLTHSGVCTDVDITVWSRMELMRLISICCAASTSML